jgi:hypothetical protein
MRRAGSRALCGVVAALALAGCGGPPAGALARVNGQWIRERDLRIAVGATDVLQGTRLAVDPAARRRYVNQLVNYRLVLAWAQAHRVGQHPAAAVQRFIQGLSRDLGGTSVLTARLRGEGLTLAEFRQFLAQQYTLTAVFNRMTGAVAAPAPALVRQYYAAHAQLFTTPDELLAREILVSRHAEALALLRQIRHGASFAALARRDSRDAASSQLGGSLGWVARGPASGLGPRVYTMLDRLRPGQYGIARTRFGYAILEVQAVRPGHPTPLAAVAGAIRNQLWVASKDRAFQHFVNDLRAHAQVVTYTG